MIYIAVWEQKVGWASQNFVIVDNEHDLNAAIMSDQAEVYRVAEDEHIRDGFIHHGSAGLRAAFKIWLAQVLADNKRTLVRRADGVLEATYPQAPRIGNTGSGR